MAAAGDGRIVIAVAPGAVRSPPWAAAGGPADQAAAKDISTEEALRAQAAKIPLGRLAEPEVATIVCEIAC